MPAPDGSADAQTPWRRLAVGMLLVEPLRELIRFIPLLIVLIFAGRAGPFRTTVGIDRHRRGDRAGHRPLPHHPVPDHPDGDRGPRKGCSPRKHLTVPRDRVRTVDISAHPLQRMLRLVKVQIGTGTSGHRHESRRPGRPARARSP